MADDSLDKIEVALANLRAVKKAAYGLGYADGRFKKTIETLSTEEANILADVMTKVSELKPPN